MLSTKSSCSDHQIRSSSSQRQDQFAIDMMTSPWGGTKGCVPVAPCSLEDVMSEQLASDLDSAQRTQQEEWEHFPGLVNTATVSSSLR